MFQKLSTPLVREFTRREFLRLAAGSAALIIAGCRPVPLDRSATPGGRSTAGATPPPVTAVAPTHGATAVPTRAPAVALPTAGRITLVGDFYVQSYDEVPQVNLDSWRLLIKGLVRQPLTLTWADIQAMASVEVMRTLECIGNPVGGHLIGNAMWRGVSLPAILERAGLQPSATHVIMEGADAYFTCIPLEKALDKRALLAYNMNGAPLTAQHGFPLRALIPGVYGQKQPKWLLVIEVTDHYEPGTWEQRGWSDTAVIQVNSRIDEPRRVVPAGSERILTSGIAFADESGVQRVEVSYDDGASWREATLLPGPDTTVWTAWYAWWERPAAGKYILKARATDGHGQRQGDLQGASGRILGGTFPNGTSEIHRVTVAVEPGVADG